ncbi:MAG TPA: BTAD domain-containing putative transcriptional regulator [Anaerolineales bacterium]|nr:BTAD domain-containing putative transcriptional regulator [Anaerolineales bacterium]
MLEVRLLGTFSILQDGSPVMISSRPAQSLFGYLILTAGIKHRREKLAGIFWPEATEEKARAYLRHELWRIRKALGSVSNCDYIIADDIHISLNFSAQYWLDANQLAELNEQPSVDELKSALSICHGELLPGFYDEWIVMEREHLHAIYEHNIAKLLDLLEKENRWQEILDWAERWLSLEPASEAAYRYLMVAYHALGEASKVISTYERCVLALRTIDLEPSEATKSLVLERPPKLNIPILLPSFIGREKELIEVADLLSKFRLVTLTGSGGVGKTRLAIQVLADVIELFPDGIWFLDLALLRDPGLVPTAVANLVRLREPGLLGLEELILKYFRSRNGLIIFDNCEHLIEACAQLVNLLLISCPRLSILATSREALRVQGEITYRVPSLTIPKLDSVSDLEHLVGFESIRLFSERAALASPGFTVNSRNAPAIVQICHRLDGIPLAIELAAARVNVLSVDQIAKRLDDRFNLLTVGFRTSLPRHQTLRATIEWSYDLLSEKERIVFRRLAVFIGGWTLEAAEYVCSEYGVELREILDLLSQLVNKSLISVETELVETRYRRLETIRQFARLRFLESAESATLQNRHLTYFVAKTEQIEPYLLGEEQSRWMDYLDTEFDNIRLALEWSISTRRSEDGFRLFGSLGWYWFIRDHHHEGARWFRRLAPIKDDVSKGTLAKAFRSASFANYINGDLDTAIDLHVNSLVYYRELDDTKEISTTLQFLGVLENERGNLALARSYLEESLQLSRQVNNKLAMPRVLMHLGFFLEEEGKISEAWQHFEESLKICREMKEGHLLMVVLTTMAHRMLRQKKIASARRFYKEALETCIQLKNKRTTAEMFLNFAEVLSLEGRYSQSAQLHGFAESLFLESETLTDEYLSIIHNTAHLLQQVLGEKIYQNQFMAGKNLNLEQATEIAVHSK